MSSRLLNRIFLNSLGILLGAAITVTAATARAEETSAGAQAVLSAPAEAPEATEIASPPANPQEEAEIEGQVKEDVGFPQLKPASYPSQVFWLFVSFTLMYLLMSKVALPPVGAVLDQRRAQREGNLTRAEQLQDEAAKAKASYETALAKAQESAQEAIAAAEADIATKIAAESAKFAEQTRKRIAAAEQTIAKAKQEALVSLADISAEISVEMADKVAGVQVSKADAKKVVADVMKKEAA